MHNEYKNGNSSISVNTLSTLFTAFIKNWSGVSVAKKSSLAHPQLAVISITMLNTSELNQ